MLDRSFIIFSFIMASHIHKFFKYSHVSIPIQDLFFILIILQKISNNSSNQFSENLIYRSDRLIDKILIHINSMK
jgi:hypothetical protein|nr:hypothetical protein [uncultured Mediterranean phage uvMED]